MMQTVTLDAPSLDWCDYETCRDLEEVAAMATWVACEKDRARLVIPAGTPVVPDPRPERNGWILDPDRAHVSIPEQEPGELLEDWEERTRAERLALDYLETFAVEVPADAVTPCGVWEVEL